MFNFKYLIQQLFMLKGILTLVFDPANNAIRTSLLPFATACTALQGMVTALEVKIADYRKLLKSFSASKRAARIALAETGYSIMSTTRSYCVKTGRMEAAEQLSASLKELKSMPFELLLSKTTLARQNVSSLMAFLVDYHIDDVVMENWQLKYDALNALMNAPSNAYKQRTDLGKEIVEDMRSIMTFFNNELSPLVANFYSTHNVFYNNFQSIRRIGSPNIHHTGLNAHVVNEIGVPYFGLTVTVNQYTDPETGKTYDSDMAVTDPDGNCEVAGFFPGMRTVTISGNGVIPSTFPPIRFKKGKAVDHEFVMQPSSFNIPAPAPNTQNTNA